MIVKYYFKNYQWLAKIFTISIVSENFLILIIYNNYNIYMENFNTVHKNIFFSFININQHLAYFLDQNFNQIFFINYLIMMNFLNCKNIVAFFLQQNEKYVEHFYYSIF